MAQTQRVYIYIYIEARDNSTSDTAKLKKRPLQKKIVVYIVYNTFTYPCCFRTKFQKSIISLNISVHSSEQCVYASFVKMDNRSHHLQ